MAKAKRHHYVPKFVLEDFASSGSLWVYDRELSEYRFQRPLDTTVQGHYYSLVDSGGKKHTVLEEMLSSLEGDAAETIAKVERHESLTYEDKVILSLFASYQMVRVPSFEKLVNEFEEKSLRTLNKMLFSSEEQSRRVIDRIVKENHSSFPHLGEVSPKEIVDFVKQDRYGVEISRNVSLNVAAKQGKRIANYFVQMDWCFLKAPSSTSFITSDNPLTLIPPLKLGHDIPFGVATPGVLKVLPLTRKTCLMMLDKGDKYGFSTLSSKEVRDLNINIALNSNRFVIATDRRLLEAVVRRSRLDAAEMPEGN